MIGFSTAARIDYREQSVREISVIPEGKIDLAFRAIAECAEEAVLDSMVCAKAVTGFEGHHVNSLADWLQNPEIAARLR